MIPDASEAIDMNAFHPLLLAIPLQTTNFLTAYNGVLVRIGLYLLIFGPTVGYYVYQDSKKQGYSSPRLRAVALGVLGIPGLLIHLGLRRSG